jgi:hypothetical protein
LTNCINADIKVRAQSTRHTLTISACQPIRCVETSGLDICSKMRSSRPPSSPWVRSPVQQHVTHHTTQYRLMSAHTRHTNVNEVREDTSTPRPRTPSHANPYCLNIAQTLESPMQSSAHNQGACRSPLHSEQYKVVEKSDGTMNHRGGFAAGQTRG